MTPAPAPRKPFVQGVLLLVLLPLLASSAANLLVDETAVYAGYGIGLLVGGIAFYLALRRR